MIKDRNGKVPFLLLSVSTSVAKAIIDVTRDLPFTQAFTPVTSDKERGKTVDWLSPSTRNSSPCDNSFIGKIKPLLPLPIPLQGRPRLILEDQLPPPPHPGCLSIRWVAS